ncbi:site-specific DNA-methyltransferase [Corynebacterium minutissimum]|uniref:DNA restriction-modification system, DNA methylase n=1 Tax=Corynebacterium minutissimum TaxID=38301 RepID=A0A2X4RF27_9CORY|nr:site-specific DNA-methyltransferase [Corynebacterium minutissimum]KHO28509.1 DNA methylase [Corynebacterium minutissimum]QPS60677.1 site-specific DNA-methyltransferase [Corynebacterium minutissimum]QQA78536.1 site-specific DNA-methyltransferase [Corynebacterium minutissimum]SQI00433.1 DNA restriction-modification system, DNA methylase [Corynebacterium minutissimum]VEG05499.1 DNA restriction-modification system, DNA methylase [Corynebacterium minutissimum]
MAGAKQLLELTWFNKDKALIPSEEGRYAYEWVDPTDPRYCETRALVVDEVVTGKQSPKDEGTQYSERADLEPTKDNLLILGESGDVLEALTRVPELREKYLGKIKCIYIDPPFNTAQTFANYEDNLEHSVWLTMMRDRLVHLRKLLSDDGSIWVHLDDVENHRMRALMDEVFGSGNFVREIVWRKTYSPENRSTITASQDFILVYAKSNAGFRESRNPLPRTAAQNSAYKNPDSDPRGPWKPGDFTAGAGHATKDQFYPLMTPAGLTFTPPPGRAWVYTESRYKELLDQNRVYFGVDGLGRPAFKRFLSDVEGKGRVPDSWWDHSEVGHNDAAKKEIQSLIPEESPFSTPKPERLLERIIHIATNPGDIVLDVFAGSGTTAAVAQKMGRRWVSCELVEDTFNRFTRPRLEKVINGEDQGGISIQKQERVDATEEGLPEGLSPEDAQKFNSALNKVLAANPELKTEAVVKALKTATKTKNQKGVVNWRGGGSFTVAHLAPQCFDYVPELGFVTLTEAATGATLVNSVAANLNFTLTPDNRHYDGKRGSMFLKVVEGRLDRDQAEELLAHLDEDEGVTLAATELEPGVRQFARTTDKPCQVVHIPNDIFNYSETQEGK